MTDRDRLIELILQANERCSSQICEVCEYTNNDQALCDTYNLADYLLANGVIVPPIEVGQTVWYVDDFTEEIEECKVYGFTVVNGKLSLLVDNGECKFVTRKWCNTKEEAEKALAERSEGNGQLCNSN